MNLEIIWTYLDDGNEETYREEFPLELARHTNFNPPGNVFEIHLKIGNITAGYDVTGEDDEEINTRIQQFIITYRTNHPNSMARIANADWLVNENKDTLTKYNNPHINYVDVTPSRNDQPNDYMPFGINIIRLNQVRYATSIQPMDIWRDFGNNLQSDANIHSFKVKIPRSRTAYVYNGKVRRYYWPNYVTRPEAVKTIQFDALYNIAEEDENNRAEYYPLAWVGGNTIYPFFDLSERTPANKAIMRFLLDKALELIPEATYPRAKPANFEEHQFTITMKEFLSGRNRSAERELISSEQSAERAYRDYIQCTRRITDLKIMLSNNKASDKEITESCQEAIEYFKKHKNVQAWNARNGELTFTLKDMKITYKKETINVPQLDATVNLETGQFTARASDKNHLIYRCHPHIFEHGGACVGNFTTIFPKIVASGKLAQVLELLIQFFESYNEGSPAIAWSKWRYFVSRNLTTQMTGDQATEAEREWADYLETLS